MFTLSGCRPRRLDANHRILLGPQRQDPVIREALAGVYSSALHYLEAVAEVGSATDGMKVVEAMKATRYDDPLFGDTVVRQDGRAVHAMYLVEVKKPAESKGRL